MRTVRLAGRTKVIVPEPSFAFYPIASNVYGFEPVSVPLDGLRINLDRMRERIDDKTRVVFLCNPNNPTGTIFEDDAFRSFLEVPAPGSTRGRGRGLRRLLGQPAISPNRSAASMTTRCSS